MSDAIEMPNFKHDDLAANIGGLLYLMTQHLNKITMDMFKNRFNSRFDMLFEMLLRQVDDKED